MSLIVMALVISGLTGANIHLYSKKEKLQDCLKDAYKAYDYKESGVRLHLNDDEFCRELRLPTELPLKKATTRLM